MCTHSFVIGSRAEQSTGWRVWRVFMSSASFCWGRAGPGSGGRLYGNLYWGWGWGRRSRIILCATSSKYISCWTEYLHFHILFNKKSHSLHKLSLNILRFLKKNREKKKQTCKLLYSSIWCLTDNQILSSLSSLVTASMSGYITRSLSHGLQK